MDGALASDLVTNHLEVAGDAAQRGCDNRVNAGPLPAVLRVRIGDEVPAFAQTVELNVSAVAIDRAVSRALCTHGCRERAEPSLVGGAGLRGHVCGRVARIFSRHGLHRLLSIIGRVHGLLHSRLPSRVGANLHRLALVVRIHRQRGELVGRVRMTCLRVLHRDGRSTSGRRGAISLCAGCAQGHAAQQRRSGGDACEKFPHLHENPLSLCC